MNPASCWQSVFNTNPILIDKRAAVTESMNKLDNEFLEKINKLIEDRLSSEKIDIGYLSDAMCMSNSNPISEDEGIDRTFHQ